MPPKRQVRKGAVPKQNAKPRGGGGGGGSGGTGEDKAAQETFAVELLWCVRQLEAAIQVKKGLAKQNEDLLRSLKTLTSGKAPVVKKRQVMSALFGDYRSKMAQEEKKMKMDPPTIKTLSAAPEKSTFLKKSVKSNAEASGPHTTADQIPQQDEDNSTTTLTHPEENLNDQSELMPRTQELESKMATCLNIRSDTEKANSNALADSMPNVDSKPKSRDENVSDTSVQPRTQGFRFVPSENTFRFNFSNPS